MNDTMQTVLTCVSLIISSLTLLVALLSLYWIIKIEKQSEDMNEDLWAVIRTIGFLQLFQFMRLSARGKKEIMPHLTEYLEQGLLIDYDGDDHNEVKQKRAYNELVKLLLAQVKRDKNKS